MLKRGEKTATAITRSRASRRNSEDVQRNDIRCCYDRVSRFFDLAQISKTTFFPHLLIRLFDVKNEEPQTTFTTAFIACIRRCITSDCYYKTIHRIFLFVANFCVAINNNEEEDAICPFNTQIFTHLIEGSVNTTKRIRLRACQLMSMLLKSLGADKGLEILLANAIQEAMLMRMSDKLSHVRVQAVSALQSFQDPDNPNCPVITRFMESICYDPCAKVRCRLLAVMVLNKRTISLILERHADKMDTVRKATLIVFSRLHISELKISQRENVLCVALQDPSPIVKKCVEKNLLPWWLLNNNGDYFRFLGCLDVHTVGPRNVCKEALYVLFRQAKTEDLVTVANNVLVDKLLPADRLAGTRGPQILVFWQCLVQFFRDMSLENDLDAILPNLTPFCDYMRQVLLGDALPESKDDLNAWSFNVSQLLLIAKDFDFGDEMGRGKLRRLVLQLLTVNKTSSLTAPLVRLMEKIEPAKLVRLRALKELVFDLHNSLATIKEHITENDECTLKNEKYKIRLQLRVLTAQHKTALQGKDFTAAKSLNDQMNSALERLREITKRLATPVGETVVRCKGTVVERLSQCLNITFEAMQDPGVKHMTPALRKLMVKFVQPVMEKQNLPKSLRLLCLRCFGAFCLLNKKVAQKNVTIFVASEGGSACAVLALQAIVDLLMCYGLAAFDISDDMDEREAYNQKNPEAELDINLLDAVMSSLQNSEHPSLLIVAAHCFCKLLLNGHLHSCLVLNALMLAWFHHSETLAQLQLELEDFFSHYTSSRSDGLELMVKCIDPLVEEMLSSDQHESISQVLLQVINLTWPGINPRYKKNVHLKMAAQMCDKIIEEPENDRAPYFARALFRLKLVWASAETLQNLRIKALEIEQLFAYDRQMKGYVTKFIANIMAEEAVFAKDDPEDADPDEPDAVEKSEVYDIEDMEVDG